MIKLTIFIPVYNGEDYILRALYSIPPRDDIEILIIDDCSNDRTYEIVEEFMFEHPDLNIRIIQHYENKGLGAAKNTAYNNAKGEYINQLDSDDYLYTKEYNRIIDEELDGTDIVVMNLKKNDGSLFDIVEENKECLCSGCARFIRREFLGDTRCPEIRAGEDFHLYQELLKKKPTEKFTRRIGYHYNFPREGSLYDLMLKGKL